MLCIHYFFSLNLNVDLKLHFLQKKKSSYSLCNNRIELIDVNSATEEEMESFLRQFLLINASKFVATYIFVHTLIKETLKGTASFLCSEFSGVNPTNPTPCRYILQSLHGHCKGTHFLLFLLKILKDFYNLMSQGTISHIFGPRNKIDFVPCLTEFTFTFIMPHFSKGYISVSRAQKYH